MTSATRATYLTKAADILERDGWCQGALHKPGVGHCLEGAIALATGFHQAPGGRFQCQLSSQLGPHNDVMGTIDRYLGTSAYSWNDHPSRTRAEVVEALRDAAALQDAASRAPA